MTSARSGHESGFSDRNRSMSVDKRHRNDIVLSDDIGGNVAKGGLRPWMCLVRQRDHRPLVIVVTNVTSEDNRRTGRRVRYGATQLLDVDRLRADGNHADFRLSLGHWTIIGLPFGSCARYSQNCSLPTGRGNR